MTVTKYATVSPACKLHIQLIPNISDKFSWIKMLLIFSPMFKFFCPYDPYVKKYLNFYSKMMFFGLNQVY